MAHGQHGAKWLFWGVVIPHSAPAWHPAWAHQQHLYQASSCCDHQTKSPSEWAVGSIICHAAPSCLVPSMQLQRVPSQWLLTIHFNEMPNTMEPCFPRGKDLWGLPQLGIISPWKRKIHFSSKAVPLLCCCNFTGTFFYLRLLFCLPSLPEGLEEQ